MDPQPTAPLVPGDRPMPGPGPRRVLLALPVLIAVTAVVVPARGWMSEIVALLLLLMAVLVNAAALGFWPGLFSALAALGVFNLFFVEPHFSLMATQPRDVVVLAAFLAAAGLTGLLAGRLREQVDTARDRATVLEILSVASGALASATDEAEVIGTAMSHVAALSRGPVTALTRQGEGLRPLPSSAPPHPADLHAAGQALARGRVELATAEGWAGSHLTFHPLPAGGAARHAIGHRPLAVSRRDPGYREQAIASVLHQAQAALERLALAQRAGEERRASDRQALRAALLSSLSHDLRTPLATILGSVTTLRELRDGLSPEARADLLAAIEEEAQRLARYVEKLLQMTRLVAGPAAELHPVDAADCARAAVARARRAFPGTPIRLDLPDLPLVMAEAGLVEQVVFSLIENAVRYAPGEVAVSGRAAPDGITLQVGDTGPGLPEAVARWLVSDALTPSAEAAGLGLPICKGIARLLGGRLEARRAAGGGALALWLPVAGTPGGTERPA